MCLSKGWWLSDEELAFAAVMPVAKSGKMLIEPTEEAVWDYVKNSPYCCGVNLREGDFLSRVTGYFVYAAEFSYEMREPEKDGKYYTWLGYVNSCATDTVHEFGDVNKKASIYKNQRNH